MMSALRVTPFCILLLTAGLSRAVADPPPIVIAPPDDPRGAVEVRGLPAPVLAELAKLPPDDARWSVLFAVRVESAVTSQAAAMLGTYSIAEDKVLRFTPRFPWDRGLKYQVTFNLAESESAKTGELRTTFQLRNNATAAPTEIVQVYPSAAELPENLLKFYIEFSAPMSQGDSYRYLRLRNAAGALVDLPFLELPQELWNREGTRLTVLLDPGRVKSDLKPRRDEGPILEAGRSYTFEVDAKWPDAAGKPLRQGFRRDFQAVKADVIQPDPVEWEIEPPRAATRNPLVIQFREPLDRALLEHAIQIIPAKGAAVEGTIKIMSHETRWQFTPARAWTAGAYELRVAANLEDRAGNSIGRAFEVDLTAPNPERQESTTIRIPLEIPAGESSGGRR